MYFLKNIFNGILIGVANVIPGLSGATIALILGIYEKLINAISSINKKSLNNIYKIKLKQVYQDFSLEFLIPIIIGIILSAILFAQALEYFELLEKNKEFTLSYFFGLILASIPVIIKMIPKWKNKHTLLFLIGGIIAITIAIIPGFQNENNNLIFIFFCGVIGIIGMVIPGLSGSYLLLILGNYNLLVKDSINQFYKDTDSLIYLVVFLLGMGFGIITLAKMISWLFKKFREETLAIIVGFVFGSLIFIWPIRSEAPTAFLEIIIPIKEELNQSGSIIYYIKNNFHLLFFILAGFVSLIIIENFSTKKHV